MVDAAIDNNLQALHAVGITDPKAQSLAAVRGLTPELIRAHVAAVRRDGDTIGLAIMRMERGEPVPGPSRKSRPSSQPLHGKAVEDIVSNILNRR